MLTRWVTQPSPLPEAHCALSGTYRFPSFATKLPFAGGAEVISEVIRAVNANDSRYLLHGLT